MNSQLVNDTARAWKLPAKDVERMARWVEKNVPPHEQSRAFTSLLRKATTSNKPQRQVPIRPPTVSKPRKRSTKTTGLEWLQHSLNSFNGSGYADRTGPEAFLDSYADYSHWKRRQNACELIVKHYKAVLPLAEHLVETSAGPSRQPSAKSYAKFQQARLL